MHLLGVALPLTAGALLFGWRALIVVGGVIASAMLAVAVWRRIGVRGQQLRFAHVAWLAALVALMLPAQLASTVRDADGDLPWLVLPAAGFSLVILMWLVGGLGAGRIHPGLVTYLLLVALFGGLLFPHYVLRRERVFVGDLLKATPVEFHDELNDSWLTRPKGGKYDSEQVIPPSYSLLQYTTGRERPPRGWLPIQGLLRDEMPPLEDLIIGGQPGPIGVASRIGVIVGGLFLLYRGLIDVRIPIIICIVAFIGFLVLPVPSVIADKPQWHWLILHNPDVGIATAVTFANYEMMASPVLFMAFFLATAPAVRPVTRPARLIYAALIGLLAAAGQLYGSVDYGPYVALLLASLVGPPLDWLFRPRPLV